MTGKLNPYTKARVFELTTKIPPINLLNVNQIYLFLLREGRNES